MRHPRHITRPSLILLMVLLSSLLQPAPGLIASWRSPATAAASGLGAPPPLALAVAVAVGGLGIRWAGRAAKTTLEMSRAGFAGWLLLAALALAQDGRVSWFIVHQCLSGYTEAVRRALEGRENIYDEANNKMPDGGPRYIVRRDGATESYNESRLKALFAGGQIPRVEVVHVDEYEYPPPFLLLPYTVGAPVGQDYFRIRPLWFGLQAFLLWVAFLISVRSASPEASTRAFAWLPAVWFMPPTLVGLQYGNFQTGAITLSVIAMAALASRRNVAGATLLGFATLGKVFPGVLVVAPLARRPDDGPRRGDVHGTDARRLWAQTVRRFSLLSAARDCQRQCVRLQQPTGMDPDQLWCVRPGR